MAALGALFDNLTLVIVRGEAQAGGIALPENARVVPLRPPVGADLRRKISVVANLRYYLKSIARSVEDADVVHTPVPGDIAFLGMIVASALRKRLFALYNGSWVNDSETTWMNKVTRGCMRVLAGGRNVMLAVGPEDSLTVPAKGMRWIFVTTIAQDEVGSVRPTLERAPSVPLQLTYLGRLSPEKGLPYLLEAMSVLRADAGLNGLMPHLTLIGDGSQRADLVAAVERLHCEDVVHLTGQLNREEVIRHLLLTDVCVLPSLTEGFPKARLDAMLCGVPVITTTVGFGREMIGLDGERGWVVPPGDVAALVAALRRVVLERLDWGDLRRRCRSYAERQTLEAWARRTAEICAQQWDLSFAGGKLRDRV
jgi:glycosyltransferase involved in cell wall biosynthesis